MLPHQHLSRKDKEMRVRELIYPIHRGKTVFLKF